MGRFRNPRYAPEFLERRLSPSVSVGSLSTVSACVSTSYCTLDSGTTTSNPDSTELPPIPPGGSTGPA
ncbi:MAG TPA: hypothetical protein VG406_08900 [Isosphaeraceae bacterium]|jgi:hypothetical protein|nr:hypothetical protein [Isosphaeraceae bacterium]